MNNRRNRRLILFLVFTFLQTLFACGPKNLVYIMKPSTRELMERDSDLTTRLEQTCEKAGFEVITKVIENETPSILVQLARSAKPEIVLLDPVIGTGPFEAAQQSPGTLFLASGSPGEALEMPPNLLLASADRESVLFVCGKIAGVMLSDEAMASSLSKNGTWPPKLGAISFDPTEAGSGLEEEFGLEKLTEGFVSVANPDLLLSGKIKILENPSELNALLTRLHGEGARLFYIRAYNLNVQAITSVRRLGGFVILDDWSPGMGFTDVTLFGWNEDVPDMVKIALSEYSKIKDDNAAWPGKEITFPLRINWGIAIPIPEKIKAIVEEFNSN